MTAFITDEHQPVSSLLEDVAAAEQSAALDVILDYYSFVNAGESAAPPQNADRSHELLLARIRLAPRQGEDRNRPTPPHIGQRSSLLQVNALYNDELGGGVELRVRPAYNDFLSSTGGAAPYSELSMGDLRLVQFEGEFALRQLELVRVTTLNISPTGVKPDGGPAWRFRAGVESRDLACEEDCLVAYLDGGAGKAARIVGDAAVFGMVTGRLTALENDDSYAQAGVTAGLITPPAGPMRATLIGGVLQQLDGPQDALPFVQMESRVGGSPRWDMRLGVEHREALETRAGFSIYW